MVLVKILYLNLAYKITSFMYMTLAALHIYASYILRLRCLLLLGDPGSDESENRNRNMRATHIN